MDRKPKAGVSPPKFDPGSPDNPVAFGHYALVGMVARGGMAEVYRARPAVFRDGEPRELVAIKCMRPQLAKETRFVDMFIREGKIAVLLNHPSIVRTFEVGRVARRYFIAMEYIGGKDLIHVLRRCQDVARRIPIPHACYIAQKMCEGLAFAHDWKDADGRQLAIINRDVSPSNVRVSFDGRPKLLDFGIAQALLKFTSEIGVLKGKFSYMSPEQVRGMPLDLRTDIFSTGIVLYEMLTTEKLFRGDTDFALMEKVRRADIDPPSTHNPRIGPEVDAIVMRALQREPADRYQSAEEFAADLRKIVIDYRFERGELGVLMRELFAKDVETDESEREACFNAVLKIDAPVPAAKSQPHGGHERVTVPKRPVKAE